MSKKQHKLPRYFLVFITLVSGFGASCQAGSVKIDQPDKQIIEEIPPGLTMAEVDTLISLEQIAPYPLYRMVYSADYDHQGEEINSAYSDQVQDKAWGCSLFAALGNPEEMLFGRNFDWDFSPGLLLYTDPQDGYASVSMVDLYYLGFGDENAFGLTDLPLSKLVDLLDAPILPFDGMNETGLAVGMAAVPPGGMVEDPAKNTIDSLMAIRKILDEAGSIEDAVEIIKNFNIDMGSGPPLHYLIADITGRSVLVEFSQGEVREIYNDTPWQQATNFLVSEAGSSPEGHCWRYGVLSRQLSEREGVISPKQALNILEDVSQESTQWSVVYEMNSGEINVVMGGEYKEIYTLQFDLR